MAGRRHLLPGFALAVLAAVGAGLAASPPTTPAQAAMTDRAAPANVYRTEYYPGTEDLAPDEMRIVGLGTGNPEPRKSQAGACWFVELGNGEKFFFDVGTGAIMNFAMLRVSYRDADKVFLSHLHTDHAGDFPELWVGGWVAGRYDRPLRVWGPSGATPELGTANFVEMQRRAWIWDVTMRHGKLPAAGAEVEVHEFDFARTQVVYEANGVKVTSFPAIHGLDGPVSYRLDWNGLSFVFSGDTAPSRLMVEQGRGADVVVHESIDTLRRMVEIWGWDEQTARVVGSVIHTQPAAAGKLFTLLGPRLAVAYHFYYDYPGMQEMYDAIRSTYSGPLALSKDGIVINVTRAAIRVRELIGNPDTYPETIGGEAYARAPRKQSTPPSQWILDQGLKVE